MFHLNLPKRFKVYNAARERLVSDPKILIELEQHLMTAVHAAIVANLAEIKTDYNESSYLYSFWKNYPPDDRGRQPIKDQYPWIEVGEHAIGCKLPRILSGAFSVRDTGLPTGADQRLLLSQPEINRVTKGLTDTAWLFVDIKSVGPRDDTDHAVMSHNQVSGDGVWTQPETGVVNTTMKAVGTKQQHDFHCSMPPLFVMSDNRVVPLVILALKPVYSMLPAVTDAARNEGQPLIRIDLACIPNGLLLTKNPAYLRQYPQLLFPGKDAKTKNPRKLRARISFEILRAIGPWRHQRITVTDL